MSLAARRLAAAATAIGIAALGAALVADSGRAQDPGRTFTVTYGSTGDVAVNDVAPKGIPRGRASLGDQFFITTSLLRNDGARGRLQASYVVGQKKVSLVGSRGHLTAVYRFADGAIFVEAEGTYEDSDTDHGTIIGGTGAYVGARGTLDSDKTRDILHLAP